MKILSVVAWDQQFDKIEGYFEGRRWATGGQHAPEDLNNRFNVLRISFAL